MNTNHADNLTNATQAVKDAHVNLTNAADLLARDKSNLTTNENTLILDGLEGKNEAERKARLMQATANDRAHLEATERTYRTAQLQLTLAELDLRLARDLTALHLTALHIAQLTAGGDR